MAYHPVVTPRTPRKKPPARGPLSRVPGGRVPDGGTPEGRPPKGGAPASRARHGAPKERPVGKPPNPTKPQLVRDVDGGALKNMFDIFPDLPRPPRPGRRRTLPKQRPLR
jgi:hypothetical protein